MFRKSQHGPPPTSRTSLQAFIAPASAGGYLLPAQEGPARKTLVLDLDRTLIDCIVLREPSISEPDFVYTDDLGTQAKVWMRPFLKQFLAAVVRDFEVVLFTAAGARHADSVLQVLDPKRNIFSHRLYGQHTTESTQWGWVKDLSRLGRPLHSTLLVDDSTLAALHQPCNLVPIRPFIHSNPKKDWDTALSELLRFLQDKVLPAPDVRHAIALHWNKICRRPRKHALHPRSDAQHQHNACTCSCHVHRNASLPPQNWFFTSWAQFLSGGKPAGNHAASGAARSQQSHAPTAAHGHKQPLQNNWMGTDSQTGCHAHSTPTPTAGVLITCGTNGSVRTRCAAAEDGCGCNYAEGDQALVAAAAAYDMRACHDDEDEDEDVDGLGMTANGRGCGCCPALGGAGDASAMYVNHSLKRSPKALEQLSGGGAAAVAASAATLISKLSSTGSSTGSSPVDSQRESFESDLSIAASVEVVLAPESDAMLVDLPAPAPAPTPDPTVSPSISKQACPQTSVLSDGPINTAAPGGDATPPLPAAAASLPAHESSSPWSTPQIHITLTPRADSSCVDASTGLPDSAPLATALSLPSPGCWYEGQGGERRLCVGGVISDTVLLAEGNRPLQCVAALSRHQATQQGPDSLMAVNTPKVDGSVPWVGRRDQRVDVCVSDPSTVTQPLEGRVRAGRARSTGADSRQASFARVSLEQVAVTVT